jgi:hypothetical protein
MNTWRVLTVIAIATAVVVLVIGILTLRSGYDVGMQLYKPTPESPVDADVALRDSVKLYLDTHKELLRLVTAFFAAIAFLIFYQLKKGVNPSLQAWVALATGLVFLLGSMAAALLGMDLILRMVGRNSVDLGLTALVYARWTMFAFILVGTGAVGVFAADLMLSTTNTEPTEDKNDNG